MSDDYNYSDDDEYSCDCDKCYIDQIDSEERSLIGLPKVNPDFLNTFFLSFEDLPEVDVNDPCFTKLVAKISSAGEDHQTYEPFVELLNKIAAIVAKNMSSPGSDEKPLYFLSTSSGSLVWQTHRDIRPIVPEIIVFPSQSRFNELLECGMPGADMFSVQCPWSILESIVTVEPKNNWDHPRAINYMEKILQRRPDKSYMLGMSCNQKSYQFYNANACAQTASAVFLWKDGLKELVHFVFTLHEMCTTNALRDESINRHLVMEEDNRFPTWNITFAGHTHQVQPFFERKGTGRRTWLAIGRELKSSSSVDNGFPEPIRVIKEMWREESDRSTAEGDLLNRIHKDGFISGVIRHVAAGPLQDESVTDRDEGTRTKERLVMASTGLRLSACESILEFLKVMYDLVETHEQVVKRGVLHCDISWYNVLCKPEHFTGDAAVIHHPTIGKILDLENKEPLCLLTDFDNASLIDEKINPRKTPEAVGTPMFMACELVYGAYAHDNMKRSMDDVTMKRFNLEAGVLEAYVKVYGKERYDRYNQWLKSVFAGAFQESDPCINGRSTPRQQPHHDMESVYWIVLWFIFKSWPTGLDLNHSTYPHTQEFARILLARSCDRRSRYMSISMPEQSENHWKIALHPVYHPLVRMIVDMGQYICMAWSRFSPEDLLPWHSHEAFKRILLREIIRMTNENDPIYIQGPRPPAVPDRRPDHPPNYACKYRDTAKSYDYIELCIYSNRSYGYSNLYGDCSESPRNRKRPSPILAFPEPPRKKRRLTEEVLPSVTTGPDHTLAARLVFNFANDSKWFI